ncbi:uncharacterized protein [Leptinotarsa decemlineata]|uniref:uncharacterized protein n=1 Tax=Leptinotarsa decemlineata TaxID=7539 RepID=UPI003D304693
MHLSRMQQYDERLWTIYRRIIMIVTFPTIRFVCQMHRAQKTSLRLLSQVHHTPCTENESPVAPQCTTRSAYGSPAEKLTPPMRSKRSKLSQMASMINDLKHINDDNIPITEETEYDVFGKSVSSQLKKLSEEQAIIVQE